MRFEVVEEDNGWSVRADALELARFADQDAALADVAERMKAADPAAPAALSVRYRVQGRQRT
ncbi:hypothetical protein [Phenylobacterium sp.]|jgi:hypothetical protein|uniref:hypothetical protein n=1 Tax=Phenylobacterium sp. TaxID=1871053 RepID=UPI0037CCAFEB